MKRILFAFVLVLAVVMLLPGCGRAARKDDNVILHSDYGGCKISGRHYHNTHVFIGDKYEPSLSEWLKY